MILNIPDKKKLDELRKKRDDARKEVAVYWTALTPSSSGEKKGVVQLATDHPYAALGIAAGCGFLVSAVLRNGFLKGLTRGFVMMGVRSSLPAILSAVVTGGEINGEG